MSVFYPGLYATLMSWEDFLSLHQAVSLLQTKSLADSLSKISRSWGLGQQQCASQKQPKRHFVVTRLSSAPESTSIMNFWRSSPSAANLLSHAVIDVLLICNYRQLQTTTGTEITTNQGEACYSGRSWFKQSKKVLFLQEDHTKVLNELPPSHGDKSRCWFISYEVRTGTGTVWLGSLQHRSCHRVALFTEATVCLAGSSRHQILA